MLEILKKIHKIDLENPILGNLMDNLIMRFAQTKQNDLNLPLIQSKLKLIKDFHPLFNINNIQNYSITDFFVKWFCMSYINEGASKEYALFRLLILLKLLKYKNDDKILPLIFDEFRELILDKSFDNLKPANFDDRQMSSFKNLINYFRFPYEYELNFSSIDPRIKKEEFKDPFFVPEEDFEKAEIDFPKTDELLIKWFAEAIIEKGYPPEIALYELLKHLKNLGFSEGRDSEFLNTIYNEFKLEILEKPQTYDKIVIPESELSEFKELLEEFQFPYSKELNFSNLQDPKASTNSGTASDVENSSIIKSTKTTEKSDNDIVSTALSFVNSNVTYELGAKSSIDSGGPCDCSGFTKQVFQKSGISLPDGSGQQIAVGEPIQESDLEPGDLVFFSGTIAGRSNSEPSHVGIYSGNGNFVSLTGHGVKDQPLSTGFWANKFLAARRIS